LRTETSDQGKCRDGLQDGMRMIIGIVLVAAELPATHRRTATRPSPRRRN
jgi:hypothetical protein